MEELILNYYNINKVKLHLLFNDIDNNIQGRIPHSSILLIKILSELTDIKNYLEIGVHNGGSMALMLTNHNIKNVYGIDLFEDVYESSKHLNIEKFNKYQYFTKDNLSINKTKNNLANIMNIYYSPQINLIRGNTYYDSTEKEFQEQCNQELDLLFIDGDHTIDGVSNDFNRYSKYVKKNGFIIFDDYHHKEIQKYCDNLLLHNSSYTKICIFKSDNSNAIDLLVQKN